jgi:hypothetical protein
MLGLASLHLPKMKLILSTIQHATSSQACFALPTSSIAVNSYKLQRVATRAHTIPRLGSLYAAFPYSMCVRTVTASQSMQNDARSRESVFN